MPIKKLICIFALFISSVVYTKEYVIGFGSCIDQDLPQPIWQAIEAKNVDAFIFLGDNVYGDHPSGKLEKLRKSYISQSTKLPKWLNNKKVISIWDDHDMVSMMVAVTLKIKGISEIIFRFLENT